MKAILFIVTQRDSSNKASVRAAIDRIGVNVLLALLTLCLLQVLENGMVVFETFYQDERAYRMLYQK